MEKRGSLVRLFMAIGFCVKRNTVRFVEQNGIGKQAVKYNLSCQRTFKGHAGTRFKAIQLIPCLESDVMIIYRPRKIVCNSLTKSQVRVPVTNEYALEVSCVFENSVVHDLNFSGF